MTARSRITLLDSTLRDGAQGEGISFSVADKLVQANTTDALGVNYIEAGNPRSHPKAAEIFKPPRTLLLGNSRLLSLGATKRSDV